MTKSSPDQTPLELPSNLQIIQNQLKTMDRHVLALHALLDLLDRPDDQRESLSEMLANLLKDLSDRQAQYQVELAKLTAQMTATENLINGMAENSEENQRQQSKKLDRILSILNAPLDPQ
ncbi:hypothetical protein OS189_12425 [Sulfitobacter sp. F26169L]|uniref:hypothetical protein n=1 Tax=Sulfitobacter sp. F26169L TaxID=2996015 RepID=UPI0022609E60|nr:hypothetical protein [Sulfitobacter sp. F26169L]MCX7567150.1 hypothetical protein [Sulfitobacter sp. F26169L]